MFVEAYKRLSLRLFGGIAKATMQSFESLRPHLKGASINILLNAWVSMMYLTVVIVYVVSLAVMLSVSVLLALDLIMTVYYVVFVPVLAASFSFVIFYIYPMQREDSIRKSIEANLPFALIHMDSVSSSGIPPEFMFDLLSRLKEYGDISREAGMVMRNIKTFGMSSIAAIDDVAERTPSPEFKQVLTGISSTISKGGNLSGYLKEMSDKSLFDYRMKREKYSKTLGTLSDIYTAVMIAAPLMMLSVLVMMNVIGGNVFGMSIPDVINAMAYVGVPMINILFIAFIHVTHPGI